MGEYSFFMGKVNISLKYGLNESIFINYLVLCLSGNKAKNNNYIDGFYWTYNTYQELSNNIKVLSVKKIRNVIDKLEAENVLFIGNYNKFKYDKTQWYSLDKDFLKEYYPEYEIYHTSQIKEPEENQEPEVNQKPDLKVIKMEDNRNQKQTKNPKIKPSIDEDSPYYKICMQLVNNIKTLDRKCNITEKSIISWANEIKLLIEVDGRTAEEVAAVIKWVNNDSFWKKNILSGQKLRAKFSNLIIKSGYKPEIQKSTVKKEKPKVRMYK